MHLHICKLINDMPWYPETKTDNDITLDKYDNIIEEAENNCHANIKKIQDQN